MIYSRALKRSARAVVTVSGWMQDGCLHFAIAIVHSYPRAIYVSVYVHIHCTLYIVHCTYDDDDDDDDQASLAVYACYMHIHNRYISVHRHTVWFVEYREGRACGVSALRTATISAVVQNSLFVIDLRRLSVVE